MNTFVRYLFILTSALVFSASASGTASDRQYFSTPQIAMKELVTTLKAKDTNKLLDILGSDAKPILESGDPVEDDANRNRFIKAFEEAHKLEKVNETKYLIEVGKDNWEFPIPLLKDKKGWYFDTIEGKQELVYRRIGRNEVSVINAVLAYVDAQREYYLANPAHEKLNMYAQKFISSPNKRDGLYYPVKAGETPSPLGELFANARSAGYDDAKKEGKPQPYLGYYYRIIKSQGPDAQGGELDYTVHGNLLAGHALIAWPAEYGNSGVMTFMVNQEGQVYEKDLGKNTIGEVDKIIKYNPDKTWNRVTQAK